MLFWLQMLHSEPIVSVHHGPSDVTTTDVYADATVVVKYFESLSSCINWQMLPQNVVLVD